MPNDLVKLGAPVVAKTVLKFLPPFGEPTKEEKEIALQEFEQTVMKWEKIDVNQVPLIPPLGT